MSSTTLAPADFQEAERFIALRIHDRTSRRVQQLSVRIDPERLTVRGIAPVFYVKQLVIRAAQEALVGIDLDLQLEVDVAVSAPPPPKPGDASWTSELEASLSGAGL